MNTENFIPLEQLCIHYEVEMSFFSGLGEIGLIEISLLEAAPCIHVESIGPLEKMVRMYQELELNPEGIDVVFNLLEKIDSLESELNAMRNRLRLYEEDGSF